jgi:copper chaperone CopZ
LCGKNFVEKQDGFCQVSRMSTKTAIISVESLQEADTPKLRQVITALPGVESVDFSVERSVAVIEFDPAQSHIDDFLRAVLKAGFKVL